MDIRAKKIISSLAQDIIREYELEIPVDTEEFVRNIGGEVTEELGLLNESIKKRGKLFTIRISRNSCQRRKRMAIVHELGHLFLHMGFKTNSDIWNSLEDNKFFSFGSVEYAYQANEFAHALLMPEDLFKNITAQYADNGKIDVSIIADFFNVPIETASVRGKNLGLFKA